MGDGGGEGRAGGVCEEGGGGVGGGSRDHEHGGARTKSVCDGDKI